MSVSVYLVINGIYNRSFYLKKLDKDERNISIEDKAKAMAFDIMGIVFGILIIIYGFIMANLLIILFCHLLSYFDYFCQFI